MKAFIIALMAITLSACTGVTVKSVAVYPEQSELPALEVTPIEVAPPEVIAVEDHEYSPLDLLIQNLEIEPVQTVQVDAAELECLALAIYHEARGESTKGQLAVGWVVVNRTQDERFPSTVCGVVKDGVYRNGTIQRNRCQFSWYCDGKSDEPQELAVYERVKELAYDILAGRTDNPIGEALFFDGYGRGAPLLASQTQIGKHRFYERYPRRTRS